MVTGNNTMRWQRLADGYRRYWYSKAALRWIALTSAVVNLIVIGAAWPDCSRQRITTLTIKGFAVASVGCYSYCFERIDD